MSVSADATLEPGMYRVRIPFNMLYDQYENFQGQNIQNRYSDIKITFRLKEPDSRRARVLTEDDLFNSRGTIFVRALGILTDAEVAAPICPDAGPWRVVCWCSEGFSAD